MSKKPQSRKERRNRYGEEVLFEASGTKSLPSSREIIERFGNSAGYPVSDDDDHIEDEPVPIKRNKKKKRNIGSEPGEKEAVGLRIIGGDARGRKLVYSGDNRVRPMKDRVRESVFNLVGPEIKGKYAIDLFTGTGALALEAISRGAKGALMIELHLPTAKNARNNAEFLGYEDKCRIITSDAFYWSKTMSELETDLPWVVFCSPPYDFYVSLHSEMIEMLSRLAETAPTDSMIVIEADERFDFGTLPFGIAPKKRRSYPPAEIGIHIVSR